MKKILLFPLFCALLLVCFSVFASASDVGLTETRSPETEITEDTLDGMTESAEESQEEGSDFFTTLYKAYEEKRGEIFSLCSAVVSLLLFLVYQKGLVPVLKNGMNLLEGQVKALREGNAESKAYNEKLGEDTLALALAMQNSGKEMQSLTESMLSRTEESEKRDDEIIKMRQCILWQARLLGEVFLASSLPEYSKEKVGRVVTEINEMLSSDEKTE